MTEQTENGQGKFAELFEVIESYSQQDYDHHHKALQVISGAYRFQFESEDMPDARPLVDRILERYDYVMTILELDKLDPMAVDAVVKVALYSEQYMSWGVNRLGKMLEGLLNRLQMDESYTYEEYAEDARVVIQGLEEVVLGSAVEEYVKNRLEDVLEQVSETEPGV